MIRQQARIKWLENSKPQQEDSNNNIMIPSLHPVHSQQNIWETWYKSKHEQLHQTTPSENEDTQSRNGDTRWSQPNQDYNNCHDNEDNADNAETTTPEVSDDDDLAAILQTDLQNQR
jgi:hypothetical protein